ncbi:MAG: S41 family peptidase [Sarcina sp.]
MKGTNEDLNKINKEKTGYTKNWKVMLLILGFSGMSMFAGNRLTAEGIIPMTTDSELNKSFKEVKNVKEYGELFRIREELYRYYDGEIDEEKLVEGAIKGMTMGLGDPYTYYMNSKEFSDFMEQNSGEYMGVGIKVSVENDSIVVVEPIEGGPAFNAGILSGDILKAVNGEVLTGKDMDKAVSLMKGKTKEEVKLTVERVGEGSFDINVMRDVVKTVNVKGEMLNNNIGYINVRAFEENVAKDFKAKADELKAFGMKGLVLDLRNNPGGYMSECVGIASNFIEKDKVIVSTQDKYDKQEKSLSVGGDYINFPLVVLINENSASASEVVSGAIRDYNAGTLVGETSFGKGIVQIPVQQPDGSALKVTISKYYTPNGENIHSTGIAPDIEVKYPNELKKEVYDRANDPQLQKAIETLNSKIE